MIPHTLLDASRLVRTRQISPLELAEACLRRIETLNPTLSVFITVTDDDARRAARRAEEEIGRGDWRGPLHGIPIALKDAVDTAGVRTTAASHAFAGRVPRENAEIVRRLEVAGAVILGKLNMHEFAYGGSSVVSYFGPVRNAWDPAYSTGGSSGGSASAVAAGLCYAAIGTDTGGSIRQPAAICGVVGLKPSYGRVSVRGVIPLAPSLDHVGPMTRSVMDAAMMLDVIAGYDPRDPTSVDLPPSDYERSLTADTSTFRLGLPRAHFYDTLHPEVDGAIIEALRVLGSLTAAQEEIAPLGGDPEYKSMQRAYSSIQTSEAYAYHKERIAAQPELYQPETRRRIEAGATVTPATYEEARLALAEMRRSIARVFEDVDLVITPTVPVPPFTIEDLLSDLDTLRRKEVVTLRNTRPFNLLALPTISVPCGFTRGGLPIGLQITGAYGADAMVLRLAHAYEQATEWHDRRPRLTET